MTPRSTHDRQGLNSEHTPSTVVVVIIVLVVVGVGVSGVNAEMPLPAQVLAVEVKEEGILVADRGRPRLRTKPSLDLACLSEVLCLSPWLQNRGAHSVPKLYPFPKEAQLSPLWGGQCLIRAHISPGSEGQAPSPHLSGTFQTPQAVQALLSSQDTAAAPGVACIARPSASFFPSSERGLMKEMFTFTICLNCIVL